MLLSADFVQVIRLNINILTVEFNTRIFSVLFREHNGDIRRMPPLCSRKIPRKSTAVDVKSAFAFNYLIITIYPYEVFCSLCFSFHKNTITNEKENKLKTFQAM